MIINKTIISALFISIYCYYLKCISELFFYKVILIDV